jgi:predicted nucleic-acid-binding protein
VLGIDTNILVRLLVADDAGQTRRAQQIVANALRNQDAVLVSLLVLIETEWVLRSRYELDKDTTLAALRRLLETRELTFENEPAVEEALFNWQDSACGFADCLIAAHNRRLGCRATATFHAKAAQLPGFVAA